MKVDQWLHAVVISVSLFMAGGCASTGGNINTSIRPNPSVNGLEARVEVEYSTIAEVPGKLLHALGDALVSVTQPIHPYHCLRNDQGKVITDDKGKPKKVWFPFWRVIGEHHGDSVVGIIYDNGWFGGWKQRPGDKLGKVTGLALLAWGSCELLDDTPDDGCKIYHRAEEERKDSVMYEDDNPDPSDWDFGSGSPVGENAPAIPPVTEPTPPQETGPEIPPVTE